jgi:uncharacterized membrane protein YbhN (UPF0104 family)
MLKALRFVLLVAGVSGAAYLVWRYSPEVSLALRHVGWGFTLYLAASFAVYALDAWGWRRVFAASQPHVGFWRLFSIRMAGEAVNKVTPLASMGGEPLKAYLLTRDGASTNDAVASVAVAKNVMTLAQIAFIFCGIAVVLPFHPENRALLLGLGIFPGIILSAIVVTAIADYRLRRKRGGEKRGEGGESSPQPETPTGRMACNLQTATCDEQPVERRPLRGRALDLWAQVADFFWAHPREFAASFFLFFLGWAAAALELLAAAHLVGFELTVADALALEALLVSVNMATFFIPANAGAQEGGFALLAPVMGIAAGHGVVLAVLRRCRDVIWVAFGLLYLGATEGRVLFRPRLESEVPA